jgi:antirestriction protein ArdC
MGNKEIYEAITGVFLSALRKGISPWASIGVKSGRPKNIVSGKPYKGMNWLALSILNFSSPLFSTFAQAKMLGLSVQKGERGRGLMKINFLHVHKKTKSKVSDPVYNNLSEDQKLDYDNIPFVSSFTVFNLEQLTGDEGIISKLKGEMEKLISFEVLIGGYLQTENIEIAHRGISTPYTMESKIIMPGKAQFNNALDYYSSLCGQVVLSTGQELKWKQDATFDELVASIGSAFLCEMSGNPTYKIMSTRSHLFSEWASNIEADPKYLINAAKAAQNAVDTICERIDIRMVLPDFYQETTLELIAA